MSIIRVLLVLLIWFGTCGAAALASEKSSSSEEKTRFTIGVVPQFEARKLHAIWQPIIDELQERTGHRFIMSGSPTIPDFEQKFMSGTFDFAYMNPYHLVLANQTEGYMPLVRDKGRTLHGVLVVRKDSGIESAADLNGEVFAFPAPNALGASLQMRQEMSDKYQITVRPKYVKTHDSVYLNVVLGLAAAGGGVQKTLGRQSSDILNSLKVIHRTTDVAPHPLAVHPRVPEKVRRAVKEALIAMGSSEQGRKTLSRIPMKKIGVASMGDYEPLTNMGLERFYVKPKSE